MSGSLYKKVGIILLISLFAIMLFSQQASAKGTPHEIEFRDGTNNAGSIQISIWLEEDDGNTVEYAVPIPIEEDDLPATDDWKGEQFTAYIDTHGTYSDHIVTRYRSETEHEIVEFEVNDDSPTYERIHSIEVTENNTGESIRIDDDPSDQVPIVKLSLDVIGTGTEGSFFFKINLLPQVASVPTAGQTGDQIENALITAFNNVYTDFVAQKIEGKLVVDSVPCPFGVAAGTQDTALSYSVKMARIGYEDDNVPTLTEWGFILFAVLLLGWMAWVVVRRRRTVKIRI